MWWLLWAGLAAGAFYGLHRLALWAESRGWIYYRTKRMPAGAAGLAMMEVASVVHPQVEHVIEETRGRQARAEQDEAGQGSAPGDREADGAGATGAGTA